MHTKEWLLAANALYGTGGFDDGGMLVQYPRETEDKLKRRKETAYYVNHMRKACSRFVGYLSKQPAQRQTNNKLIGAVINNIDMQGNHIDQFMQQFAMNAKARGSGLVLVDMPRTTEDTEAEQIAERNAPYFVEILPENITDYEIDKFGAFEFIEFSGSYKVNDKTETVTYHYDKQGWRIIYGGKSIVSGEYNLGMCPVIGFGESGSFPSLGSYYQIAELSKRLYNAQSELDEILRSQTFSLLTYHVPLEDSSFNDSDLGSTASTQNMLVYRGNQPGFIAPPDGPATLYLKYIKDLEERINSVANNVDLGAQQQSGAALALRFQNMNADLLNFARRLEDFERKLFDVVCAWLSVTNDVEISYPQDFNLIDKTLEIEVLQNMQALGAPKAYVTEKMKQIVNADLVGVDTTEIFNEIEEIEHERDEE